MTDNTIITPTTGADTADFEIPEDKRRTLSAGALAGAETVELLIGQGEPPTYVITGVELDINTRMITVQGPGRFRANKGATVASVGVFLDGGVLSA